jgi:hypothetical protein
MAEHDLHHNEPRGAYETSDANVPVIYKWGVGLFVVMFGAMALMFGLHLALQAVPMKTDHEPTAMEMERMLPPKPRLQVNQQLDLKQLRDNENTVLHSYGWVRKESGAVHIPIDRAMDLLVERGLPAVKPQPAQKQ